MLTDCKTMYIYHIVNREPYYEINVKIFCCVALGVGTRTIFIVSLLCYILYTEKTIYIMSLKDTRQIKL